MSNEKWWFISRNIITANSKFS